MKPRLNTIALILCITFIAIKTNAQGPHAGIFIHALYAAPLDNNSHEFYKGGAGGEGGILVGRKNTLFIGSIGYARFLSDNSNPLGDKTYVPVKAGIREYIPLTLHFLFLQADAGVGFVSQRHSDETNSPFAYDFQAGVKITAFEAAIGWDTFHENNPSGWSSWFTVKAGINLGF